VRIAPALSALLLAASPAAAWWFGPKFTSQRRQRPVSIDGEGRDWPALERDDAADMSFSFTHDDEHLYVLFAPHTRGAKAQLGGAYGQDLSLWFDPEAAMNRVFGARITAPQKAGTETVRLILAAGPRPESARIMAKAGALDEHGVLEASIPLELFGRPAPKVVTVGLEADTPLRPPPRKTADPKDPASHELFAPVRLWVRVKLKN
jgi:hypothetical protein